jgi:hypothetical protein
LTGKIERAIKQKADSPRVPKPKQVDGPVPAGDAQQGRANVWGAESDGVYCRRCRTPPVRVQLLSLHHARTITITIA